MATGRNPSDNQLEDFKRTEPAISPITTGSGAPVGEKNVVQTVGPRGPILLQDNVFIDEISHFNRERIPERVVHAKGSGAHGYFEVTNDISAYTSCKVFEAVGKRTPVFVRFSIVAYEKGIADTIRDPRGFAVKFYTEDGNWDLVGNNTPTFYIRDPILFPSFVHSQKRNPQTNLLDPDMIWDFVSLRPETCHQVMFVFSDRGIPDGYRHMNGYGSHTFQLSNSKGEGIYCKFHFKTDQGIKCLPPPEASRLAGSEPDYAQKDLYDAIAKGNCPSWTLCVQLMTTAEAEKFQFNPFDVTKVWPQSQFPLIPVGKMVLNRNPTNYFADVEQSAFSPSHFVPGVGPSPDKMLQGRMFAYPDTQRYRLGVNYQQLPINCPYRVRTANYQRDGPQTFNGNQGAAPNYFPNSFGGPGHSLLHQKFPVETVSGEVGRYNNTDEDNFTQAGIFWRNVLKKDEQERLVDNIARHVKSAQKFIRDRTVVNFTKVDAELGRRLRLAVDKLTQCECEKKQSSL